jgi:hypothetical protein
VLNPPDSLEDGQEVHVKEVNNPLASAATSAPATAATSAPGKPAASSASPEKKP